MFLYASFPSLLLISIFNIVCLGIYSCFIFPLLSINEVCPSMESFIGIFVSEEIFSIVFFKLGFASVI